MTGRSSSPASRRVGKVIVSDFTRAVRGLFSGNISNYRYQALPGESGESTTQAQRRTSSRLPDHRLESADGGQDDDESKLFKRRRPKVVAIALLLGLLGFLVLAIS